MLSAVKKEVNEKIGKLEINFMDLDNETRQRMNDFDEELHKIRQDVKSLQGLG